MARTRNDRSRNDGLRAAREASPSPRTPGAGLSRDELAEAVNAWLAEHTGRTGALDGQAVGRWERGAVRRPNRGYRTALRSLLDATDEELGFADRAPARAALAGFDPEGVLDTEADERITTVSRWPRRIDRSTLAAIAAVLASVRHLEDETSAAEVAPHARAHAMLIERLARETPEALRPQAVGLASEIAQYRGWLAIPDRQWTESHQHLDRAVTLAHEAGDPQRLTTALSFSAYRAMRCDQLSSAEALSRAAREQTRIDTGLRTYLAFQRTEVSARRGHRRDAARALVEGDALIEQLPPVHQLPDSGYWYTPAFFLGQRAFAQAALGDHHDAQESAAACLAEMPAEWSSSEWAARRRALAEAP